MGNEQDPKNDDRSGTDEARRRLLRIAAYTAPAVLATLSMSRKASATTSGGCNPNCTPGCGPNVSCGPPAGGMM